MCACALVHREPSPRIFFPSSFHKKWTPLVVIRFHNAAMKMFLDFFWEGGIWYLLKMSVHRRTTGVVHAMGGKK